MPMESDKVREAWVRILWCYIQERGAHDPPTMEALDEVLTESAELYRCTPPDGLWVTLLVQQSDIEYCIPTEAEVAEVVGGMKGFRSGGPSGMRT